MKFIVINIYYFQYFILKDIIKNKQIIMTQHWNLKRLPILRVFEPQIKLKVMNGPARTRGCTGKLNLWVWRFEWPVNAGRPWLYSTVHHVAIMLMTPELAFRTLNMTVRYVKLIIKLYGLSQVFTLSLIFFNLRIGISFHRYLLNYFKYN
jgi:hypothetical protein